MFWVKKDTTWPATQVCPRPVEAGLGGHRAGVFGVDEGTTNPSLPILKWGRTAASDWPTFSVFIGVENDHVGEKWNYTNATYNWPRVNKSVWSDLFLSATDKITCERWSSFCLIRLSSREENKMWRWIHPSCLLLSCSFGLVPHRHNHSQLGYYH